MDECCCPEPQFVARRTCASCSAQAAPVGAGTVKALLTPAALARLPEGACFFCASERCDTVYFSDGGEVFSTADVKVGVWQKQPPGARTICYCFGENEREMAAEVLADGRTAAVDRVRRHISDGNCACDVRNPRGVCCLGELTAAVKRLGAAKGAGSGL